MNTNMYGGNRVVLLPRFEPKATLDTMVKEKVNFWVGVPTMYWALLKYVEETGYDISRIAEYYEGLHVGRSTDAGRGDERVSRTKFDVRVMEGYGLSETSPLATFNHFEKPSKPGTVGQAIFGVEVKCFDDNDNEVPRGERGEVVIRGTNVMKGYYKRPEATAEAFRNGWFHTGDIGIMDDEGYLVDRRSQKGHDPSRRLQRLSARARGSDNHASGRFALRRDRRRRRAARRRSQGIRRAETGSRAVSETEFIEWCKTQFAANKYPRYVEFRDELPIGGTGKIFKRALREEAAGASK